jgi:2-polyprenyl-3-methyl-5-hydroxy-6-metoxy-1,4-benzoquinol methylase
MKNCPYCNNYGDDYFKIGSRVYYRCLQCDLIFRDEQKSYDEVVSTLSNNYFSRYSADQMEGRRNKLFYHILNSVETKTQRGRLLDVGTGCGFFLLAAKKRGWNVDGIEPSAESVEVARRLSGVNVLHGTLQDYQGKDQFDAVTLVNVLEYSALPWREIDRARLLLRTGGQIYIRFVNGFLHSRLYRLAKKIGLSNRISKFLVFHYYSFTPRFIKTLLADKAFTEVTIHNSPLTEGDPNKLFSDLFVATNVKRFTYFMARCIEKITNRQLHLGTSLEVTASKADYPQNL